MFLLHAAHHLGINSPPSTASFGNEAILCALTAAFFIPLWHKLRVPKKRVPLFTALLFLRLKVGIAPSIYSFYKSFTSFSGECRMPHKRCHPERVRRGGRVEGPAFSIWSFLKRTLSAAKGGRGPAFLRF